MNTFKLIDYKNRHTDVKRKRGKTMSKQFSQSDVNRIVNSRLKRERERMAKEFEKRFKDCAASIHLTLYQQIANLKRDMAAEISRENIPKK